MELTISYFKNIREEIKLSDLSLINYLVGVNGSGKSSILNALSLLVSTERSPLIKTFFEKNGKITLEDAEIHFEMKSDEKGKITREGAPVPFPIFLNSHGAEMATDAGIHRAYFQDVEEKKRFEFFNETLKKFGLPPLTAERIVDNSDAFNEDIGKRVYKINNEEIRPEYFAEGFRSINELCYLFATILPELEDQLKQRSPIVFLIEEPENNLHPSLQKIVPALLDELIKTYLNEYVDKIVVFVSSHSPFIVSGASNFENQKIYILQEGKLVDINNNIVLQSSGYSGGECAWVVGQMLGGDVTDLGYPENYCILEEYSLQIILENAKAKGIIRNIQFISASGVARQINLSDTVNELCNLNTLIKCNPYYFDKYFFITDNSDEFQPKEKEKLENIRTRLRERYHELSASSIENFYFNLDSKLADEYIEEAKGVKGPDLGRVKSKYAILISDQINNKEDFSSLFNNELDFLFK